MEWIKLRHHSPVLGSQSPCVADLDITSMPPLMEVKLNKLTEVKLSLFKLRTVQRTSRSPIAKQEMKSRKRQFSPLNTQRAKRSLLLVFLSGYPDDPQEPNT